MTPEELRDMMQPLGKTHPERVKRLAALMPCSERFIYYLLAGARTLHPMVCERARQVMREHKEKSNG